MKKDKLYNKDVPKDHKFAFNSEVTDVFEDMVNRSVPGYEFLIENIGYIAKKFYQRNTNIYDLGSSLCACSLSVQDKIQNLNGNIYAVDSSPSMIDECKKNIDSKKIKLINSDIASINIENCSVIILNLTLQFISKDRRTRLLKNFFDNLNKHGVIIITEKIIIDEIDNNKFSKNFHDFFKENKGYSKEEIDRKKIALENVMLLESEKRYEKRFNEIGCTNFFKWFQCYNFISWVLVK